MRVLVSGNCGFIGRHVAKKFIDKGFEVYGVDRAIPGDDYPTYIIDLKTDDITPILKQIKPDVFVHCAGAASVPQSVEDPFEDYSLNAGLVHRILFSLKKSNLSNCKFLFLSSAAVYGQPQSLPVSETYPLNPLSPYALHKQMAEDICLFFIKNYNFDIDICRVFSAYGPGLRKQIFWDMYNKIEESGRLDMLGTGEESRDYIYIDDLTEALYLISKNKSDNYIWNIASGIESKISEVAKLFASEMGISSKKITFSGNKRSCDPNNWRADISKIKDIGFSQKTTLSDGIRKYVHWAKTEL